MIVWIKDNEDGSCPPWRAGISVLRGVGGPPWGMWFTLRGGTLTSLHGLRGTAGAVRWVTRPRWPGGTLTAWGVLMAVEDAGRRGSRRGPARPPRSGSPTGGGIVVCYPGRGMP